jgi:hypothetical protein
MTQLFMATDNDDYLIINQLHLGGTKVHGKDNSQAVTEQTAHISAFSRIGLALRKLDFL